jgi:hypothetical protein
MAIGDAAKIFVHSERKSQLQRCCDQLHRCTGSITSKEKKKRICVSLVRQEGWEIEIKIESRVPRNVRTRNQKPFLPLPLWATGNQFHMSGKINSLLSSVLEKKKLSPDLINDAWKIIFHSLTSLFLSC